MGSIPRTVIWAKVIFARRVDDRGTLSKKFPLLSSSQSYVHILHCYSSHLLYIELT